MEEQTRGKKQVISPSSITTPVKLQLTKHSTSTSRASRVCMCVRVRVCECVCNANARGTTIQNP